MSETIVVSGKEALDLILPACTGMGYRTSNHIHNGLKPFTKEWYENEGNDPDEYDDDYSGWVAAKRVEDDKIFVADFYDEKNSPYYRREDYDIDEFGGVVTYDVDYNVIVVVPTPDVTFRAATLREILPEEQYTAPERYYILED